MATDAEDGPVPELTERAQACADRLREADSVLLASHIDADGLTSAGVATQMLERAGIDHEVQFCDQLDEEELDDIADTDHDTVLFTDFGSGQADLIAEHEERGDFTGVIADHHQPVDADVEHHLNPILEGLSGASDISGAGTTYVLSRALGGEENKDLAKLAVVGALGDQQDGYDGLEGANEAIVDEGVEAGVLERHRDINFYGRQTRKLPEMLKYADEAWVPGVTGDDQNARQFLYDLEESDRHDIEPKRSDGSWKRWVDLGEEEQEQMLQELAKEAAANGSDRLEHLRGETYRLVGEEPGTALRDASEFGTVLNATGRYDRSDVGLAICLGNRGEALRRATALRDNHSHNIGTGIRKVMSGDIPVQETPHLQYFDARDEISDTTVGIVAGIVLENRDCDKPMLAFSWKDEEEGRVKVSARGLPEHVDEGLDFSPIMEETAKAAGGEGGGHDVAAGATIPEEEMDHFIAAVGARIHGQMNVEQENDAENEQGTDEGHAAGR